MFPMRRRQENKSVNPLFGWAAVMEYNRITIDQHNRGSDVFGCRKFDSVQFVADGKHALLTTG